MTRNTTPIIDGTVISPDEQAFIQSYRDLPPPKQKAILVTCHALHNFRKASSDHEREAALASITEALGKYLPASEMAEIISRLREPKKCQN